jgi:hypothetical protein
MQSMIGALFVVFALCRVKVGLFLTQKQQKSAYKIQTQKNHTLEDSEDSSIKTVKVIFVYYVIILSFL